MSKCAKYFRFCFVKTLLLICVFTLNYTSVLGNGNVVDSLIQELKEVKADTQKVKLLLDIGWEYHNSDPAQTIVYAQRAYDIAHVIDFQKGACSALNLIGIGYDVKGDLSQAMTYYQSAYDLSKDLNDIEAEKSYLNNIGLIHQRKGDYQKSMECFHRALEMTNENKDKEMASILMNNIGIIHSVEERYEQALKYFESSLAIERTLDNHLGISMALTNMGEQYKELGKRTKALICYKEALTISKRIDDKVGEAILLSNIGELHYENDLLDLAGAFYPQALALAKETGDKGMEATVLDNMAKLNQKQQRFQKSIAYAQEGLLIAQEMGDKKKITDIFETLTAGYVGINDYEKAFEYKSLFNQAKDSLYSAEKSRQILELSTQYETKRKETENQLLKEQQAKNEAIIKQRTTISLAITLTLMFMSIIAIILYKSNRNKNRYSQQLENEVADRTSDLEESNVKLRDSNKELERFAYIASHDLKEPLRNIMSFTRLVERRLPAVAKEDQNIQEYFGYIINNTKQMHQLIEDVLEYSRIDSDEPESKYIAVRDIVDSVLSVITSTVEERNVRLNIGELPKVNANASQLFLVLKNLIENGIKYNTNDHPVISVYGIEKEGMYEITVADNGIGIEEAYFNRIFGMFKRLHNREEFQGSGLGLSICKKIIQHMGGDIWVESQEGQGSKFTFSIPVSEKPQKERSKKIAELS